MTSQQTADLVGSKFGDWLVLSVFREASRDRALCKCGCGKERAVRIQHLLAGTSQSCGHASYKTHGKARTKIYSIWRSMRSRCERPADLNFMYYGRRGIVVCDRWKKFENFYADMGDVPEGKSIDRINVDGNYEPANCRWATNVEQRNNTRRSKWVVYQGSKMTLADAIRLSGCVVPSRTVYGRVDAGWELERAMGAAK